MDKDFIRELINLIKNSDIRLFEIEYQDFRLRMETHQRELVHKVETPREVNILRWFPLTKIWRRASYM
jgi:hypothetical protein